MICCWRWFTMHESAVSSKCHGWSRKDMFGGESGQCPVATDEIKLWRCNHLKL